MAGRQGMCGLTIATVTAMSFFPIDTLAQPYPSKVIRMVVAVAPGGTDDMLARLLAQGLTEAFGRQVIVENRPGGGAMIGREHVARSAPDGYTLIVNASSLAAVPALRPSSKLDVVRDFTSISLLGNFTMVLVVHPSVPAKTVKELIALAKANPAKLSFGSAGTGQTPHLAGELFKFVAKINIFHVPYQGGAPAFLDLVAGRVDMIFGLTTLASQQVRAGKVRALGVTAARRSQIMPEVPTIAEAALPGYEMSGWYGLFGPAGMGREPISLLNNSVQKTMNTPDVRQRLLSVGLEVETSTPEQLGERVKNDVARLGKIIRDAGIALE